MENRATVVAVLGYGCHLTPEYKAYLERAGRWTFHRKIEFIITSGGYTNESTMPNVSEAHVMASYLRNTIGVSDPTKNRNEPRVIEDDLPIDTRGNLEGIERILCECTSENAHLIIFCDSAHALKVRLLSLVIHRRWPEIKTYPLTKGLKATCKQRFIATPLEVAALFVPYLERKRVQRRERIIANS